MKCVHCNYKFTFKERMKAAWKPSTDTIVICPKCGGRQYISNKRMAKSYGLMLLVELILIIAAPLIKIPIPLLTVLMIIALALVIVLFPLSLKLVAEKDGLLEEQFREMEKKQKRNSL
ncbi:TIGR04104 family putative zinc finger protein [Macrococcus sp. FSL W8-0367]